jgi:hypothetical protein
VDFAEVALAKSLECAPTTKPTGLSRRKWPREVEIAVVNATKFPYFLIGHLRPTIDIRKARFTRMALTLLSNEFCIFTKQGLVCVWLEIH